ncbi:MAG: SpoIVB peptidase S55 domain-containing protein [Capsulimonadaceae bacterium]
MKYCNQAAFIAGLVRRAAIIGCGIALLAHFPAALAALGETPGSASGRTLHPRHVVHVRLLLRPGSDTPIGGRRPFNVRNFMPLSEIRPGMRGYALTTFRGTQPQRFNIEIIGVVAKYNLGKDYILFRALDGPSVTRGLNIAHGMSGSPIYVDGRLVGAISMGIQGIMANQPSYPKEPMALATPIEEMLDAWSPDLPKTPSPISARPDSGGISSDAAEPANPGQFAPLDIPMVVSGVSPAGVARLSSLMAPFHMNVVGGAGTAGSGLTNNPLARGARLQPGSPIGVALIRGDIEFTGIGTVTYREGNRILMWGHEFEGLGPIDAPMETAYIVDGYPSYQDSVMIGGPIRTVGRVFQDRPFSLGGVVGPLPKMIPVTVDINDLALHVHRVLRSEVISHPLLSARLISFVAGESIGRVHGLPGDSMATVTMDVDAEEIGRIVRTNTYFDPLSIEDAALGDLDSVMQMVTANPFYPLAVKSVKLSVTIRSRHDTAEIDHIFVNQSKYAPGDIVEVGVAIKPFKQPTRTHFIHLKIPANAPTGSLDLEVKGGGGESSGGGISLGGLIIIHSGSGEPQSIATNVKQLVKEFNERPRNNELVARLLLPSRAVVVAGEKLSNLPPTISGVMQSNRTSGIHTERDEVKVVTPLTVADLLRGSL